MKKSKGGRPRSHGSEARMDVFMSDRMKELAEKAAHHQRMNRSAWVRRQLAIGIRRVLGEEVKA